MVAEALAACNAQEVIVANTIPVPEESQFPCLTVLSVANLLGVPPPPPPHTPPRLPIIRFGAIPPLRPTHGRSHRSTPPGLCRTGFHQRWLAFCLQLALLSGFLACSPVTVSNGASVSKSQRRMILFASALGQNFWVPVRDLAGFCLSAMMRPEQCRCGAMQETIWRVYNASSVQSIL